MSMLKAKLYQLEMEKKAQEATSLRGEQMEIGGLTNPFLRVPSVFNGQRPSDKLRNRQCTSCDGWRP